ncbi:MAG TPA: cytochrome c family protein [Candidatus Krumholzibacteria bacterium]|nr:cytochrome c family protein [Candidatus Krumholzibacteria bacterium]
MQKRIVWASMLALVLAAGSEAQEKKAEHKYIGVKKCSMCHKAEAKGNQFGQWQASKHAKAFETLAGAKALAIAKEKGLAKPPQESPECLKCHVTGYGKAAELFDATFAKTDGVQCESCHGPGSDYQNMKVMKDRAASVGAGLVIPDEKTCTVCHNAESPSFVGFDFKKQWALVSHPNPLTGAAK